MENEIIERLKSIHNREAIQLFFSFLNTFLTELKIDPDNPKVSLNIRNDYRQRISVNLNGRIVLGLAMKRKKIEFLFMVNQSDTLLVETSFELIMNEKFGVEKHPASLIGISYDELSTKDHHELISLWIKSCKEYEPAQEKSQYRSHNMPILFDMAQDEKLLNTMIDKSNNHIEQMDYIEYQKKVFDWLMAKHNADPSFCFSTRVKSNKGSEKSYFIGTERAKYFGTTFWNIPCSFPGSAVDLIDLTFSQKQAGFKAYFQFFHTRNPVGTQNILALDFLRELKKELKEHFSDLKENPPESKSEDFTIPIDNKPFDSLDKMLDACNLFLIKIFPIIDGQLTDFKSRNEGFDAMRIDNELFQTKFLKKLHERLGRAELAEDMAEDEMMGHKEDLAQELAAPPLNQILYGPPGTGKTYSSINIALSIIENKDLEVIEKEGRKILKSRYDEWVKKGIIDFITFHQNMSYEDFIEGIKPIEPKKEGDPVVYQIVDGIFKRIARRSDSRKGNFTDVIEKFKADISEDDNKQPLTIKAKGSTFDVTFRSGIAFYVRPHNSTKEDAWYPVSITNIEKYLNSNDTEGIYNPTYVKGILNYLIENRNLQKGTAKETENQRYVLIIDEINRGNIAQIFGELITLIEKDKRFGKDESLEVILPYSKEKFSVPPNLYIIGTMNTADRSVEALDTALRRRFNFVEMTPNYNLDGLQKEVIEGMPLKDILRKMNQRIEKLLDKDHMIGHSYFLDVKDIKELKRVFKDSIIPLLQEYFFGDTGKIALVLDQGFFKPLNEDKKGEVLAKIDWYEGREDLEERVVVHLKNLDEMKDPEFEEAIRTFMEKPENATKEK